MERQPLIEEAVLMKATAKNINTVLRPKLLKFKHDFTPNEWQIIELALDNYMTDMINSARRLEVLAEQKKRRS
ncbi:MAG: hypothetical protein EOO61_07935 [Hymenobacter sp.]|nr:MAG: hypothetical protein EOO61_07935 [Hymenobacter sp.]